MDQYRRPPRRVRGFRRVLRSVARTFAALVVFVLALPILGLFALRFPSVRAFVSKRVDSALAASFQGRIHLRELERVDLGGVRASGSIDDPSGRTIVRFEHATVDLDVPSLLVGVIRDHGSPSRIVFDDVKLTHGELRLIDDGTGSPTLAKTFAPRTPSPPSTTPSPRIEIHRIAVAHLWVHGALAASPYIDVDMSKLGASLVSDPKALDVTLDRLALDERFLPYNPHGTLTAKAHLPAGNEAPSVSASYDGTVVGTKLEAKGSYAASGVSADVLLPSIDTDTVRRIAPDLALTSPVRVSVKASGPLERVGLNAEVQGDAIGAVRLDGTVRASAPVSAAIDVELRRLNAAAVVPTAPKTDVDAKVAVKASLEGERWRGSFELALTRALVNGQALPPLDVHGSGSGKGSAASVEGDANIHETGTEMRISYRAQTNAHGGQAEVELRSKLDDPPRVVKLADVRTRGELEANALFAWPTNRVDATAELRLESVRHPVVQTGPLRASFNVRGELTHPELKATVFARSVHAQGRDFETADLAFAGTAARADVGVRLLTRAGQGLSAHALVETAPGKTEIIGPSLGYRDHDGSLQLSAARVVLAGTNVDIDRFVLDGAGHVSASATLRGKRLEIEAHTRELELGRLAKIAGLTTPVHAARATLDVRYAGPLTGTGQGSVHGSITDIDYARVNGGWVSIDLDQNDDGVSGMVEAELVRGAKVVIGVDDIVPSALLSAKSWAPKGRVRVRGKLDLTAMTPLIAAVPTLPLEDAKGSVELEFSYARSDEAATPELKAHVRTHELTVVGRRRPVQTNIGTPGEAIDAAPSVYRGLDIGVDLALDERDPHLAVRSQLYDKHGTLLEIDVTAGPWLDENIEQVLAGLRQAPFTVKASMPARKLALLPQPIRPLSVSGTVGGDATLDGSVDDPHLVLDARASQLTSAGQHIKGQERPSVAVIGHVEYANTGGRVELIAQREHKKAVDVRADWSGNAILAASDAKERARLSVKLDAALDELDLSTIPALKNRQIEGVLSGTAHAEYGAKTRTLSADFAAHPLRVGLATIDRVNIEAAVTPNDLKGLVLVRGKSGSLDAKLNSGLTWPAGGTPSLTGAIQGSLVARDFRLATLSPMLGSAVNELDGRFNAELSADVNGDQVTLRGHGRLSDGVVQLPSIGQRFQDVSVNIDVEPTVLVFRDLEAHGLTGEVSGEARIEVDQHLGLRQLTAELAIPKHHKLPITVQGVAMGDAWGRVEATVKNSPDKVQASIRVPELHLAVPDSGGGDVQDLAPDDEIRVGSRRKDTPFVALPVQPLAKPSQNSTPLELTLELGKNVEVQRGDMVTAQVSGKLDVHVTDQTSVNGEIDVKGGTLDVQGKEFHIERGTVTFAGTEPSNPVVSAEARWDSPAGYAVYATYAGTAKKGSLTLRAEPPLTQDEIFNLILFGSPEGSVSSGSGDTATTAVGAVGGTATKGINRALSDFTHMDIQARIDTSTGESRPEVLVPVNRRLSARVTYAVGEPPPGTSPDRTFLTLELRLKATWLLSAMVGDRGASALDLVWRKHY
jgi:translocation and assembly module TamB